MGEGIEIGSKVNVYFHGVDAIFNVEVLHIPKDVGDSWKFKTENGTHVNAILYSKMEEVK